MVQNSGLSRDWNEYASNYDSLLKLWPYTIMLEEVAGAIQRSRVNSVLDAGCGTGNLLTKLAILNALKITGMDSSAEMLARAEEKCPNVQLIRADLNSALPFSNATFAAVTCVNALYAVENPSHTLGEFARILKTDGFLVIVTPKQGYENGLILKTHCGSTRPDEYWENMHTDLEREETLMREALSDETTFQQMRTIADVNRRISQNARFHFFTEPELRAIVITAGFSITDYWETYAQQSHLLVARRA